MTRTVAVMAIPDPDTCTHEEWEAYLATTDWDALSLEELDARRGLVERYTERLWRETDTARDALVRSLDARDRANADADALTERCRLLQTELIEATDAVLDAGRTRGYDSPPAREAAAREAHLMEALSRARAELAVVNQRAIQAILDAR